MEQTFVGIKTADIYEAELKNGVANVTVKFVSELISATRDRGGEVVNGDPKKIKEVTDIWTFSREVASPQPQLASHRHPGRKLKHPGGGACALGRMAGRGQHCGCGLSRGN